MINDNIIILVDCKSDVIHAPDDATTRNLSCITVCVCVSSVQDELISSDRRSRSWCNIIIIVIYC